MPSPHAPLASSLGQQAGKQAPHTLALPPAPPAALLQPLDPSNASCSPSTAPAMPHRPCSSPAAALATTAALLLAATSAIAPAAARAASFVVETGSMRIRQPQDIAGSFDSAIGDVSGLQGGAWAVAACRSAVRSAVVRRQQVPCEGHRAPLTPRPPRSPRLLPAAVWSPALWRHADRRCGLCRQPARGGGWSGLQGVWAAAAQPALRPAHCAAG